MTKRTCSLPGCQNPHRAKGLCSTHYNQQFFAGRHEKILTPCANCGTMTMKGKSTSRRSVCSIDCRYELQWGRKRPPAPGTAMEVWTPTEATVTALPGTRQWTAGTCRVCSAPFISRHTDITCSPECRATRQAEARRGAKYKRRMLLQQATIEVVYRKRIFQADNYRCHLCGRKTLPSKTVPHPRAPTLDHIIPLAQGGTHEPSNCATACFSCNARKSDTYAGQLRMFSY